MTRVVINADDLGLSPKVNSEIGACLADGLISSATIIANAPAFEEACELASEFAQRSFGVHLNATEFRPLTGSSGLDMFLDHDGAFNGRFRSVMRRSYSLVVADEWSAQIERALKAGVRVSHLDSHHHAHTAPGALYALKLVQKRFGIVKVRTTRNLIPTSEGTTARRVLKLAAKGLWHQALRRREPITTTTDYFGSVQDYHSLAVSGHLPVRISSTVELMCHPGSERRSFAREIELLQESALDRLGVPWRLVSYMEIGE